MAQFTEAQARSLTLNVRKLTEAVEMLNELTTAQTAALDTLNTTLTANGTSLATIATNTTP